MDKKILCPHCGKPMRELLGKGRLIRELFYPGDEDSYGYHAREAVPTWVCDDCKIKHLEYYTGWRSEFKDEWIFPKDYEKTITPKQEAYIRHLCKHNAYLAKECDKDFWILPYITNIDLASNWISEHTEVSKRLQSEAEFRNHVVRALDLAGYSEHHVYNNDHSVERTTFIDKKENDDQEFYSLFTISWNDLSVAAEVRVTMNLSSASDYEKLFKYIGAHDKKLQVIGQVLQEQQTIYTNKRSQ